MILRNLFFLFLFLTIFSIHSSLNAQSVSKPKFSVPRGFYVTSFDVTLSTKNGEIILYTLDGSDPRTSGTAITKSSPAAIQVNPESTEGGRAKSPGFVIRACSKINEQTYSDVTSSTYIFLNKLGTLSPENVKPGTGWPEPNNYPKNYYPQFINYGMDKSVLNDARYNDIIDDAMLAVPTISISTDLKNLFNADSGIYMNALSEGAEWERFCSVELVNPPEFEDSTNGFQINAGLRIRGGYSRHGENPKHAFRLFFRSEYGEGKLKYPLFGDEGVKEFDKVDLRTSQNYSWSYPGHQGEYNIMIRDVFSRDLQREMGQPYTRSRFYHLYINGVYWGLFQTQERTEARFASSYLGGNVEDYDVVKNENGGISATDGTLKTWENVWNITKSGFNTNLNYFKIQGKNSQGVRDSTLKVLVDIDNLIDYMLIIFFTGNYDSPTNLWSRNKSPNNFYCFYNRNGNDGYKFFIHDAEHSILTTSGEHPDGAGLYENRVNIGQRTDEYKMTVSSFNDFQPQWLHFRLSSNSEYRMRFADHVYKHFFNDGALTPKKVTELFLSRAKEIEMAIIGESARWGNTYTNPARTKDDDWLPAINDIVDNYFPKRTSIVLDQLKEVNLYPSINTVLFKSGTTELKDNYLNVQPGYILQMSNPNNTNGTILYSLDGQDPRVIGGGISTSAVDAGDLFDLNINSTTIINARIKNGDDWSALHKIILFTERVDNNLKLSEINYHPLDVDSTNDDEYEFIELKNNGTNPINLSGAYFSQGINYTFPDMTVLNPNEFFVIASNRIEFNNLYGFVPSAEYSGQLNNGGETITLQSAGGDTIFNITFNDKLPWPESPDGGGYSLVLNNFNGNMNDPSSWRASFNINGSPGKDDISTSVDNKNFIPAKFNLSQNFPNPFNPRTVIKYSLTKNSNVQLTVYDMIGQEVTKLVDAFQSAGNYSITFSANSLSSGIYLYRIQTNEGIITKKMLLMK